MAIAVLFVSLFVMILIGIPVGYAIGGATILTIVTCTDMDLVINAQYCFSGLNSFTLICVPFFMLAGALMSAGGIASRIVEFCKSIVGAITGGLGAVVILSSTLFGAISGSGMATTSAIGSMMIPEMKKEGYGTEYAATLVCFGGIVGPIIPPSMSFILYGVATNTSISDLFLAGVLPGATISACFLIANYVFCKRTKMGRVLDGSYTERHEVPLSEYMGKRVKRILKATKNGFWALLSPVIILGGIYAGIFTPTEAACVSVVYSLIISVFVYKELNLKKMYKVFVDTAVLNGITSFLLAYSTVFSSYLTASRTPNIVADALSSVTDSKVLFLLIVNFVLLLVGCFLDTVPAIVIMAPLLYPVATGFGVDPVHFGILMSVNLAIGLCTPPYGCNLFVGAAVGRIKMEAMFKYVFPLLAIAVVALLIITYVPHLSLVFLE